MKVKLSVIVTTYNRPKLLEGCLASLFDQTAVRDSYEVIIVDNNFSGQAKLVVDHFERENPKRRLVYVFEKKQGLSYARNAGCEKANAQYLAYIDDDAKAFKDWVENIIRAIDEIKPDILGGPIYPYYLYKKPLWFKDEYEIRSNGEKARFLLEGEYLSGSNFIIKKEILKKLGMFNPDLGMIGDKLRYGEETRLMIEAREKISNVKIYYNPEIKVEHLVKKENMVVYLKLKDKFIAGMRARDVFGEKRLPKYRIFTNINKIFLKGIFMVFFGFFFRNKEKYSYYENFVFERVLRQVSLLAKNLSYLLS